MEGIAIKAAMTACSLLLQKPHSGSKSHDHATALERRLKSWEEGDIDGLMREGRTIQNHFRTNHGKRMEKADMEPGFPQRSLVHQPHAPRKSALCHAFSFRQPRKRRPGLG